MKKLIIEERIDKVDNLIEEKEADQLIDLINNWKKTFGNFKLKFESYGHDGGYDIILYQIREETDSEYKTIKTPFIEFLIYYCICSRSNAWYSLTYSTLLLYCFYFLCGYIF